MSVARVTEITARANSYEEAIKTGVERANKTLRGVTHVYIKEHEVYLENGSISQHQVNLKVTFLLDD